MSGSTKSVLVSDQEFQIATRTALKEEGQVFEVHQNFLQRFHNWIKLDKPDVKNGYGRWSNAGKSIPYLRGC
jgi:hypothetical protein